MTEPTAQDIANADYRRSVADRQLAEYRHAEALAELHHSRKSQPALSEV
jgi:hypothetical protein